MPKQSVEECEFFAETLPQTRRMGSSMTWQGEPISKVRVGTIIRDIDGNYWEVARHERNITWCYPRQQTRVREECFANSAEVTIVRKGFGRSIYDA